MNLTTKQILLMAVLALLILGGCGKRGGAAPKLAEEKQPVTVETLTLKELDDFITVSGKLEGSSNITMSSEASGRIVEVYKKLGDRVAKGERIGRLDNDAYQFRLDQSEAALASAQSAFDTAQRNLNFAEESLRKTLISQAEYNAAITAYKGAKAALDGAKAGLETARSAISGSYLSAPEAGTISFLNISRGQYINIGAPVATITDASRLLLKTGVGESQIGKLSKGQPVWISYSGLEEPVRGSLRGFGITPLAGTATYPVEIELPGGTGLLPGMVVTARILTDHYTGLLYTSITNIINEFGDNYAFVIDASGKARKREVTLGSIIGEYVVLESGLAEGDRIVTSGAENLEEGSSVEIRK